MVLIGRKLAWQLRLGNEIAFLQQNRRLLTALADTRGLCEDRCRQQDSSQPSHAASYNEFVPEALAVEHGLVLDVGVHERDTMP